MKFIIAERIGSFRPERAFEITNHLLHKEFVYSEVCCNVKANKFGRDGEKCMTRVIKHRRQGASPHK